ncbi:hypothetical protein ACFE04_015259 [Oxalis oulophora]
MSSAFPSKVAMVNACLTCRKKLLDKTSRFCDPCGSTVCDMCGVRGFDEGLIYCNDCENYATHRYCLPGSAPVPFHEYVVWFCEDCEPKHLNSSKLADPCSLLSDEKRVSDSDDVEMIQIVNNQNKRKRENENENENENEQIVGSALSEPELHDHSNEVELISDNCEEEKKVERIRKLPSSYLESSCQVQAQPIINPIWRGTLSISESSKHVSFIDRGTLSISKQNFGSVGRLSAHLSSLACQQVSEAAKLLPELLCTDLVSRSEVWPKGFENDGPNDVSIALYFFPENVRYESNFDRLVDDMITGDQAMKTIVDNAELLVFTSKVLPLSSWRFQSKFYLWGVFRGKQVSSSSDNAGEKSLMKSLNSDSPSSNCAT